MLKQARPNKISRSPSRLCSFQVYQKKKKQSVGGSVSLFDVRFMKKEGKKAERTTKGNFKINLPWFCKVNMALFDRGGQIISSFYWV